MTKTTPSLTLDQLRRYAIGRSLFKPTTLLKAIAKLGFVQADPIRAPARAQDLTLRHRVTGYRVGELERRYPSLPVEEDAFINYGFVPRQTQALMHPRVARHPWSKARSTQAAEVLEFVRAHGTVHPRDVAAHFEHGTVKNWFGGSSNATTQLLDEMHYRGLVRIAGRAGGVRLYSESVRNGVDRLNLTGTGAGSADPLDALVDIVVAKYAPVPERTLSELVSRLRFGAPQLASGGRAAFARAKVRLASTSINGVTWYWPRTESPAKHTAERRVRLLSPFDPVVWDRRRFELFWGWAYRFEAYTPAPKRVRGYYALPLLWGEQVIGWGNLSLGDHGLEADIGYVSGRAPAGAAYRQALRTELDEMSAFLK